MITKQGLGLIDSQDAVFGNIAYDLASLIDDVRFKTDKKFKDKIFNQFIKKNKSLDRNKFQNDFEILSVLRNFKIIGIFTRLSMRDNKNKYLKLIPYAWKLIELRTSKNAIFKDLNYLLSKNFDRKIAHQVFSEKGIFAAMPMPDRELIDNRCTIVWSVNNKNLEGISINDFVDSKLSFFESKLGIKMKIDSELLHFQLSNHHFENYINNSIYKKFLLLTFWLASLYFVKPSSIDLVKMIFFLISKFNFLYNLIARSLSEKTLK